MWTAYEPSLDCHHGFHHPPWRGPASPKVCSSSCPHAAASLSRASTCLSVTVADGPSGTSERSSADRPAGMNGRWRRNGWRATAGGAVLAAVIGGCSGAGAGAQGAVEHLADSDSSFGVYG